MLVKHAYGVAALNEADGFGVGAWRLKVGSGGSAQGAMGASMQEEANSAPNASGGAAWDKLNDLGTPDESPAIARKLNITMPGGHIVWSPGIVIMTRIDGSGGLRRRPYIAPAIWRVATRYVPSGSADRKYR